LTYGTDGIVAAPLPGQSICYGQFHHVDAYFTTYYLDNSPTIGAENNPEGREGKLRGRVIDPYDQPVAGVTVKSNFFENDWPFFKVSTDSSGKSR